MALKLAVLFALLAATNAGVLTAPGPLLHAAPVARAIIPEPYDPNPQYSFGYEVNDPLTGDSHGQIESRSGDVVKGSYALLDSDGTRRVVDYTADPINGFNAVVSKNPVITKVIAPAPVAVAPAPIALRTAVAPAPWAVAPPPVAIRTAVAPAPVAVAPAPVALRAAAGPWASEPIVRAAPVVASGPWASEPIVRAAPVLSAGPWAGPALPAGPWAAPAVRSAPVW